MTKLNLLLICIVVVISGAATLFYNSWKESEKDNSRLKRNELVLCNGISKYKTKLDNEVVRTSELQRKVTEFNNDKTNDRLKDKLKELNIKLKYLQSATTISQKIDTVLKDSIVYVKDCMELDNKYIYVKLCPNNSNIIISDTIDVVEDNQRLVYTNGRSKLFFIRWFQDKYRVVDLSVTHTNKLIKTNDVKKQVIINK